MTKLLAVIVAMIVGVTTAVQHPPREPEKMNTACMQMCPGHHNANG